ncbi:MAG TPA: response regulator [Candidatus Limnocylindria bacterium]|nr:response regulator [Candidatus Limnocylindria bacterium]
MPSSATSAESPTRVLVVDADRRVQQSMSDALQLSGRVDVVGRAGDVRTALELIALRSPGVVVMDPRLPDLAAAVALVRGIQRGWPTLRIVMIAWSDALENAELARAADAIVAKNASPEEFVAKVVDACCSA